MPYTDQGLPHAGSAEVLFTGLFDEPAGTTARTIPRFAINTGSLAMGGTGIVQARCIPLPAGLPVSNIMILSGATAEVGGTHFWCGLTDVNSNVLAVTADQTGGTYVVASTFLSNPVTIPYVIPQTGLYYVVCSVSAGTTMPTMSGLSQSAGVNNLSPVMSGTMGTQAAPPAVGSQLSAVVKTNGINFGAWLS